MSLNKMITKSCSGILKLLEFTPWNEQLIKKIELTRGLYQYPDKMVGRKLSFNDTDTSNTDVLIFAAHSDDDVLELGATLYRHYRNGDNIKIIFVTNGSAYEGRAKQSWNTKASESKMKSETRYTEAAKALSLLNIPKENIFCLGYPDCGTQRYLKNISDDVLMLLQKLNPGKVYVHCIEGGHIDHDMTSFAVKSACDKIGYSNVFEWAGYNPEQPLGTKDVKFLSNQFSTFEETIIDITEDERMMKREMLSCHKSQNVEEFYLQGEAIRQATLSNLDLELFEHCQRPKYVLSPIVKKFNTSFVNHKAPSVREEVV